MERAAIYLRVSTMEQASEGVSLEAQEERLRAYCHLASLDPVAILREEGVSGGKPLATRPGGAELIDLVARKRVAHVVALKLDRLFRDTIDCLTMARTWDKAGVALHLVDMGGQSLNTASAMGRVFLTMTAAFAELERNLISERTGAALAHKKTKKVVYARVPFGYDRQGDTLIPNTQEQRVVEKIKTWRAAGWTLGKIAAELTRRHVPTKRGGAWYPGTVKYLLENNLYQGAASS
jgi:DNA invertase Pin-like site-specific DNA recombinase